MRHSGNLQQQPLMGETLAMVRLQRCVKHSRLLAVAAIALLTACTRMPVEHQAVVPERAQDNRLQVIAQTGIGASARYIEASTGVAVTVSVLSEYFSAAGRNCRKFSESRSRQTVVADTANSAGTSVNVNTDVNTGLAPSKIGLVCRDAKQGWVEVPVHSIAG